MDTLWALFGHVLDTFLITFWTLWEHFVDTFGHLWGVGMLFGSFLGGFGRVFLEFFGMVPGGFLGCFCNEMSGRLSILGKSIFWAPGLP